MNEIKSSNIHEIKEPENSRYKDIKSDGKVTLHGAFRYWGEKVFAGIGVYEELGKSRYNSYETRLEKTPKTESELGSWDGPRGDSIFRPNEDTPEGRACAERLKESCVDGIKYINGEPDFSPVSVATVRIGKMTEFRENAKNVVGNFNKADVKCAEMFNIEKRDGRTDWTPRDIYNMRHDEAHPLTWHERCDTHTMDLVPREIHSQCKHSGGVSECRVRDGGDLKTGGDFDD